MLPYIHLGPLSVPTFGLMLWLAAVAGGFVMDRSFRRAAVSADAVTMVLFAVLAGIVGAKIWHVIDTPSDFREVGWRVLWSQGGFAWFGGMVAAIAVLIFQGVREKIGALRTLDLAAPAAALGYGIGRIGCFLSGDGCYGKPTNLPWGMAFPNGIEPVRVPVHPTPLYELFGAIIIALWLWRRQGRPHSTGSILAQYLVLTGIARFLVEFVRRNPPVAFGFSNAQLASLGSIVAGIALMIWVLKRGTRKEQAVVAVQKTA